MPDTEFTRAIYPPDVQAQLDVTPPGPARDMILARYSQSLSAPEVSSLPALEDPNFARQGAGSPFLRRVIEAGGSQAVKKELDKVRSEEMGPDPTAMPAASGKLPAMIPWAAQSAGDGLAASTAPAGSMSGSASVKLPRAPGDVGGVGDARAELQGNRQEYTSGANTYQQTMQDASNQIAQGADRLAELGQARALEEAAAQDEAERLRVEKMLSIENQQKDIQRRVDDETTKLVDINAKYEKAHVDPAGFFKSWGEGGAQVAKTALAAVSVALGAYGAALTGGRNTAYDILNGAIQQDIQAQQANIANLGRAGEKQQNLVGDLYKQYRDMDTAKAAADILMTKQAIRKLEQVASRYKAPEIQAKAQMATEEWRLKLAEKVQTFQGDRFDKIQKGIQAETAFGVAQNNAANAAYKAKIGAMTGGSKPKGKAMSDKQAADAYMPMGAIDQLNGTMNKLMTVERDSSGAVARVLMKRIPDTDSARVDTAVKLYGVDFIHAISGAQASDAERENLMSIIPATDATAETNAYRYTVSFDSLIAKAENQIQAMEAQGKDTSRVRQSLEQYKAKRIDFTPPPSAVR